MNLYSNNSYLARACYVPFILIWMIIRAYQSNRTSFSPFLLVRLDPRSLFTYSLIITFLAQFAHDFLLCYIRYIGGYDDSFSGNSDAFDMMPVSSSSTDSVTTQNLILLRIAWYLDATSMGLIISCLFALQAYWSSVMGQLSRRQFISTLEYWTYLVLAISILPIFPILEFIFHSDILHKELIPNLVFSGLSILICLLSIRTQFGITTLINTPTRNTILPQTHGKLVFFQDMNLWLLITLFIWSVSSLLLCVYSLFIRSTDPSKFIIDFLSANSTFGQFIVYIILISVVYPDFNISPVYSLKRTISSPYNVTKPKTFDHSNFDIGDFHELNDHTAIDISHQDIASVHSDSNSSTSSLSEETSQTKSTHSKYSATSTSYLKNKKKHSKRLKSHGVNSGRIEKSGGGGGGGGGGLNKKYMNMEVNVMPTSTISSTLMPIGSSAIENVLAQQIMVETQKDVVVEPAYMHAYINPHIPSPRYARSPTSSGSRPTSTTTDLLLAPLPSPSSDFAAIRNIGHKPNQYKTNNPHMNNSLTQHQDSGTLYSYNGGGGSGGGDGNNSPRYDARQRVVRNVRSTTPPVSPPSSSLQRNQQNRSQGQGNPIFPIQQQFSSQLHQQIYSPSPQSHLQHSTQFYAPSSQPNSQGFIPSTKRNSLSSHRNNTTMLSRSATRSSEASTNANRNSIASSNDGDGSGISEDELIRSSEKRASWHQQTRGRKETLNMVREGDDDNDDRPLNPVSVGNEISYVEQLRVRRSMSGSGSEYEKRIWRQEGGSELNGLSRRVSGSSRRSTSETKEYDEHLRPPARRSLQGSSNRSSESSYSTT